MASEVERVTRKARELLSNGLIHNYEEMLLAFTEITSRSEKTGKDPEIREWLYANTYTNGEAVMKQIWNAICIDETDNDSGESKGKFLQIPHNVLDDPKLDGLKTGEFLLYIVLWRYCWGKDRCNPSIGLLARGTKASTKSVERWLYGYGDSAGLTVLAIQLPGNRWPDTSAGYCREPYRGFAHKAPSDQEIGILTHNSNSRSTK